MFSECQKNATSRFIYKMEHTEPGSRSVLLKRGTEIALICWRNDFPGPDFTRFCLNVCINWRGLQIRDLAQKALRSLFYKLKCYLL